MNVTGKTGGEDGRAYVGTSRGSLRAIAANAASESGAELQLSCALWELRVCPHAVTASCRQFGGCSRSMCGVEASGQDKGTLLLVGSASGELVVLREDLEVRRFQLESAVQQICYDQDGTFIVGDALGNLYGVTQYDVLWKKRLPAVVSVSDGTECFYPPVSKPTVKAIVRAKLLDVEKTLSNYVLVATGQKHLLVTHCGDNCGVIPTQTPIETLASISAGDEDVVLAAGENGIIYHLVSYRDMVTKDMLEFHFAVEVWAKVSFPVKKLLPVKMHVSTSDTKPNFAWICLGVDGEAALFRGQECVKQWSAASFSNTALKDFHVDLILLNDSDAIAAFPERIQIQ
ncbi:hypothetical protein PHPALM_31749 [Phytophthora palmivora]|uniref:Uncharacterized protein n=1 Tax=Phytophthora palmivora TaxID=4796 RepID=A0A2P4X1S9_9STRA|nr:hypothetical protein PHPALM_31749 [Phytophthora palmivora]